MTLFWLIGALLVVLTLACILPAVRGRRTGQAGATTTSANVAVYRRQFAELASDHQRGLITNEQFEIEREELEYRLSLLLHLGEPAIGSDRRHDNALGIVLAAGLPLAAIILYLLLGNPASLLPSP